mmetsp:Transcript_3436/g.11419  ORF Transcript_3436/g.11419 Transcript_3436/m.11419 type:complete len:326 (+) Transcript_3436:429-1406(+)
MRKERSRSGSLSKPPHAAPAAAARPQRKTTTTVSLTSAATADKRAANSTTDASFSSSGGPTSATSLPHSPRIASPSCCLERSTSAACAASCGNSSVRIAGGSNGRTERMRKLSVVCAVARRRACSAPERPADTAPATSSIRPLTSSHCAASKSTRKPLRGAPPPPPGAAPPGAAPRRASSARPGRPPPCGPASASCTAVRQATHALAQALAQALSQALAHALVQARLPPERPPSPRAVLHRAAASASLFPPAGRECRTACAWGWPVDSTMPHKPAEETPRKWWLCAARPSAVATRSGSAADPSTPAGIERPDTSSHIAEDAGTHA